MENREVARILRETSKLLEIDGAIIGRYRSYDRAADLISSLTEPIAELARDLKKITALPGIGVRMAEHIREILEAGDLSQRKELLQKYPVEILGLLALPSLGPKKACLLWEAFQASTVAQVEQLAREGKLRDLPGFGKKTEENILKSIEVFKKSAGRFLLDFAEREAAKLIEYISAFDVTASLAAPAALPARGKLIQSISVAGSLRRHRETVGDLDLLLTLTPREAGGVRDAEEIAALARHILAYGPIEQVLAQGENKVSFRLVHGLQVDVRLLQPENFGAALIYFTGSKEHNVALRGRALKMGYTLNEYQLATVADAAPGEDAARVAGAAEEEVYAKLGLDFIPPELRENCGEIEAAAQHTLPHLIELRDLRGDLQMHTTATDGKHSIEAMAAAARALGYEYIAITDHSKALAFANGMDEARTLEQARNIRSANERDPDIHLLAGIEVDVLKDGRLDLPDDVLAELDIVVVSVHSFMGLEHAHARGHRKSVHADHRPPDGAFAAPARRFCLRHGAHS